MAHIVVFAGEYDVANKSELLGALSRLESSDDLVLDLTAVTYVDCSFIAGLFLLEKARRARSFVRLKVVTPAKSIVRRLFEVCGITSIVALVEAYDRQRMEDANSVVEFAVNGLVIKAAQAKCES